MLSSSCTDIAHFYSIQRFEFCFVYSIGDLLFQFLTMDNSMYLPGLCVSLNFDNFLTDNSDFSLCFTLYHIFHNFLNTCLDILYWSFWIGYTLCLLYNNYKLSSSWKFIYFEYFPTNCSVFNSTQSCIYIYNTINIPKQRSLCSHGIVRLSSLCWIAWLAKVKKKSF